MALPIYSIGTSMGETLKKRSSLRVPKLRRNEPTLRTAGGKNLSTIAAESAAGTIARAILVQRGNAMEFRSRPLLGDKALNLPDSDYCYG